ncbi:MULTISPECIES: hypothetical protein [unclassified Synechocystis]|uniref:hypothetical protein n=1 Tax=unclassified Synechocystis TaxID=2640012 RepID=UPI00040EE797|nr:MULTISPECIES: hypothetical protein [unclassified Synechocystis]AIE74786.1 hypothetical protein D082_22580 [Synechocystis sp. PCC 6714]
MNYRVVVLSGVMTALLGTVFGWGMGQIALRQRPSQVQVTMSQPYRIFYGRRLIWFGAIAGFVLGAGQACVLAERKREKEEMEKAEAEEDYS